MGSNGSLDHTSHAECDSTGCNVHLPVEDDKSISEGPTGQRI